METEIRRFHSKSYIIHRMQAKSENFNATSHYPLTTKNMMRTDKLKAAAIKQDKPINFAVFNQQNVVYFTNFSGATALLVPEEGENTLYVTSVNYEQAKADAKNCKVELLERGENVIDKITKQLPSGKLCVDSLSIESWYVLAKAMGGEDNLEVANYLIRDLRKVKDSEEIMLIREACRMADIGAKVAGEVIRPGLKEKEVAAEVEYAMRKAGSDGVAFETIIASGYCCAYPHGTFLEKTIKDGDLVVVDLGASCKFYRSDITRTFIAGKVAEKETRMFETVKLAQQKAFEAMAPHVLAREVDCVARRIIKDAGYGDLFVHNLGHGVGLEVHEAPILSPDSKDVLEVGNVVTDEPGVYLPGFGGVRIEDTILVTENGSEKLTHAPITLK
jgi:Xaa-Pro dipeptidase